MQSLASHHVAYVCQFMNTMRAQCTNVTCYNTSIESISILTFQAMRSANQISITTCFMADEKLIEDVCCFPCLWQVSSKSYKDARARENAWKEVASLVTEQTANRNNILLSCYLNCIIMTCWSCLVNIRHTHIFLFLSPSSSSVKQTKQQHFSLHDEGEV